MKASEPEQLVAEIAPLMKGFGAPWCVAGGWAIGLWLGRRTREHADVELAVFRLDQSRLHSHLAGWSFTVRVDGESQPWRSGEALELPLHEIHARSPNGTRALELLLSERDATSWIFRRDPRITLSLDRAVLRTGLGVDVLAPEIVLLFKARSPREKDEADFASVSGALSPEQRAWLGGALATTQPGHRWIDVLAR